MNQRNYQKELEKILSTLENSETDPPRLLLHSCCAPCSSYCMEYLCTYFRITVFYFNPNISAEPEYRHRAAEQKRLIAAYNAKGMGYPIEIVEGDYEPCRFLEAARGYEDCPEGGERCFRCFALRLEETAKRAAAGRYDYFATTLTISPLKNARKINEIGQALSAQYGVAWLPSDFKKKDGYKRSVELSEEYGLYRQDYCGCAFSKAEREHARSASELSANDCGKDVKTHELRKNPDGIEYRTLCAEEIEPPLFHNFIRHQIVTECWRKRDGKWCVEEDSFVDDWSEADYRFLTACLRNTVVSGGLVYGAFCEDALKGFVSVEPDLFGEELGYLDLSSIHVSEDLRGRGIGRVLFAAAKDWARQRGAGKLYISAHSSVESQSFYHAMGCVEAKEYNQKHVEAEPYDCQLECEV